MTFPIFNTSINVSVDEPVAEPKKSRRYVRSKRNELKVDPEEKSALEEIKQETVDVAGETDAKASATPAAAPIDAQTPPVQAIPMDGSPQPLLMAEVVNVTHEKFRQTEEIKVIIFNFVFLTLKNLFLIFLFFRR